MEEAYKIVTSWDKDAPKCDAPLLDRHRIAILPMRNFTADPTDEFSPTALPKRQYQLCAQSTT
jgi:hypothetical protein